MEISPYKNITFESVGKRTFSKENIPKKYKGKYPFEGKITQEKYS